MKLKPLIKVYRRDVDPHGPVLLPTLSVVVDSALQDADAIAAAQAYFANRTKKDPAWYKFVLS